GRVAASGREGRKRGRDGRGQEADSAAGAGVSLADAGGVVTLASRAACQWSGSRSPSCPAGVVGKRVSTSCRYAHGSTPSRWHVDVKLKSTAAVWPPRGEPTVNQFFLPIAILLISRSAALLSMARKPASV